MVLEEIGAATDYVCIGPEFLNCLRRQQLPSLQYTTLLGQYPYKDKGDPERPRITYYPLNVLAMAGRLDAITQSSFQGSTNTPRYWDGRDKGNRRPVLGAVLYTANPP